MLYLAQASEDYQAEHDNRKLEGALLWCANNHFPQRVGAKARVGSKKRFRPTDRFPMSCTLMGRGPMVGHHSEGTR